MEITFFYNILYFQLICVAFSGKSDQFLASNGFLINSLWLFLCIWAIKVIFCLVGLTVPYQITISYIKVRADCIYISNHFLSHFILYKLKILIAIYRNLVKPTKEAVEIVQIVARTNKNWSEHEKLMIRFYPFSIAAW